MAAAGFLFFLLTLCLTLVVGVEIQSVRLVGSTENYLNVNSNTRNTLQCNYRVGYNDKVKYVNWYKDSHRVYHWSEGSSVAIANRPLAGRVEVRGESLQNIHFLVPAHIDLAGTYVCEVVSTLKSVKSQPYNLGVIDVPSDNYTTSVTLLETVSLDNSTTIQHDENCTLMWQFKTPAIYPRPNVTCGYYSYLHDDVNISIPAGLAMQRLNNGSWIGYFDHTTIEVADIPRESRLGCSVSIPGTSYKRVTKFEDSFTIDHLIDSQGCPALFLDPIHNLHVDVGDAKLNCRGDLVPLSSEGTITVKFKCNDGSFALFPNGTAMDNWSADLMCNAREMIWKMGGSSDANDTVLPNCIPMLNAGATSIPGWFTFFATFFLTSRILFINL